MIIFLGDHVERSICQVEVEHNRLGPIGSLRSAVGEQGLVPLKSFLRGLGVYMKCALGKSPFIFKAFMPGTRGKRPQRMGSRS